MLLREESAAKGASRASVVLPHLLVHSLTPATAQSSALAGRAQYIAAVACLKKALYLDPFAWIISYNLGLVHLHKSQFASAFHFFSSSINLKPDFSSAYMYLAITLANLDDFDNSCAAYEKALSLDGADVVCRLNYAVTLLNSDELERSREQIEELDKAINGADDQHQPDDEVLQQIAELKVRIGRGR